MSSSDGIDIELQARDGLSLHVVHHAVARPRGVIVFLHGLSEHARRHGQLARHLQEAGWSVLAPDMRGHGHSGGMRGRACSPKASPPWRPGNTPTRTSA